MLVWAAAGRIDFAKAAATWGSKSCQPHASIDETDETGVSKRRYFPCRSAPLILACSFASIWPEARRTTRTYSPQLISLSW